MPSDQPRHPVHPSRLRLPVMFRRSNRISPATPKQFLRTNGAPVSLTCDPSNPQKAFRIPSHSSVVTSDALQITLPVPPSINHQYATVNGRRVLSSVGRAYKTYVGQQVWLALAQSPARCSLQERFQSGPLTLSIRFFFASALRRDLDGGLKIAQDAICEGLGLNDNRISETHLYKQVDKSDPRIEVSLSFLHPLQDLT